jgi:GTP-binding protein
MQDIRNIAIIAHVDHGKTTLVDKMLVAGALFREHEKAGELILDNNDLERERGITIVSKNVSIDYKGTKINIIDTPGHADFGGEVERVLKMVNGVILVVDAFEGAMPQTKFVLRKALELQLPVIVCINKIDRPEARPEEVIDEVLELFIDLDASDEQLECPFVYASAKSGYAVLELDDGPENMIPLFETILDYIPAPEGDPEANTQVLISTIDYNEYVGRIGVGKVENGSIRTNQEMVIVNEHDPDRVQKVKISKLYEFDGLEKVDVKEAQIGAIVAISGIADISIGDTLCAPEDPVAIPFQKISEPTIAMHFVVNDSPFAGLEGKYVTSRHLRGRLLKELNTDVSLRVEETENTDSENENAG